MKHHENILTALLAAALSVSCSSNEQDIVIERTVTATSARTESRQSERNYTFISTPFRSSELSFRVSGPVTEFDVQNGQFFRKGELIAAIDDRDFIIRKQRAEAICGQAEAEYLRTRKLYMKDNVSLASYEKAKAQYENARADYMDAVNALEDTRLFAPFDGYVQKVNIEKYQDVKASFPIVTFIDLSKVKAEISVPEHVASDIRQGKKMHCSVTFDGFPGKTYIPSGTYVNGSTSDNNISYTYTAVIENPDNELIGGMSGTIELSSDRQQCLSIPLKAVCGRSDGNTYVWILDSTGTVRRRNVKTGRILPEGRIEISSGIDGNDRIVTEGLYSLSEGEKVTER